MKSLCLLFSVLLLTTAAMPLSPAMPVAARAVPLGVLDVTTWGGEHALVHFSNGAYLVTNDEAGALFAEYGNPEVVAHFSWLSDGIEVVLDVRMQAGESEAKFGARCAKTVEVMKAAFPPDPSTPPAEG